ncbi:hypothetical protein Pryu01_00543 [Paraliobacillus ryukyuensis]|uniref:Uncharacterized protein n=1 Tax=Paraliobacillus ryukyuensis TaxID=200904 RepID=A0A366EIY5_9BACI|nr:hypothetical protein DES48_101121 [Paraliobacillus ryukyuensis]
MIIQINLQTLKVNRKHNKFKEGKATSSSFSFFVSTKDHQFTQSLHSVNHKFIQNRYDELVA